MRPRTLRLHRLLDRILAGTLDAISQVVAAMPKRTALAVARFGGRIAWFVDRRGRKAGDENLRASPGEATAAKERRRGLPASVPGAEPVNQPRSIPLLIHLASPDQGLRHAEPVSALPGDTSYEKEIQAFKAGGREWEGILRVGRLPPLFMPYPPSW